MSSTATTTPGAGLSDSPAGAFTSVLNAAVRSTAASLEHTVESWTNKLNSVAGESRLCRRTGLAGRRGHR